MTFYRYIFPLPVILSIILLVETFFVSSQSSNIPTTSDVYLHPINTQHQGLQRQFAKELQSFDNSSNMFGQRNYVNRMSQLQMQGQSNASTHRCTTSQYQHRGHPNYSIHHRAQGIPMHSLNYSSGHHHHHQRRNDYRMLPQWYLQTITMPQTTKPIPMKIHHRNSNDNHLYNEESMRAIRENLVEDSLFPHGDPLPQDYLNEWDQRPECPRLKWTHQENPSWQPPIRSRHGEYTGTELILAKEAATPIITRNGHKMETTPVVGSLIPSLDHYYENIAKNILDICGHSDNSDCSSVKSNSSCEFFQ